MGGMGGGGGGGGGMMADALSLLQPGGPSLSCEFLSFVCYSAA